MASLYNLARMTTATTGAGTITLGSAAMGFLSFALAGVQDGNTITYAIEDGSNREIGRGVYTASGTTLTRTVLKSTNSDNPINLSGSAQVFITAAAEDILSPGGSTTQIQFNDGGSFGGSSAFTFNKTNPSLALAGGVVTASTPVLGLSQTWANSGITFTGLKLNVTDTNSASFSLLLDLQVGGASQFSVNKSGLSNSAGGVRCSSAESIGLIRNVSLGGLNVCGGGIDSGGGASLHVTNSTLSIRGGRISLKNNNVNVADDCVIFRAAAATLQLGAADAAAPVAQTLRVQSVSSGTTNTAGADFTIQGSRGTGTGAGGSLIFQVAPAGTTGTAQNAYATALTIASDKSATFASSIFLPNGTAAAPALNFWTSANPCGIYASGYQELRFALNGNLRATISDYGIYSATYRFVSAGPYQLGLTTDSAQILALREGTNAQAFRVYSTTASSGSYGYLAAGVTNAGVATADTLFIGTGGAGAAMTKLALVVNGTTVVQLDSTTITITDADNIAVGTTTGTKIGTATSQKISFWNATPIVQPTTGVASATVASTGTGDVVAASTTFDGYTIPQIVKALRNAGLLA